MRKESGELRQEEDNICEKLPAVFCQGCSQPVEKLPQFSIHKVWFVAARRGTT